MKGAGLSLGGPAGRLVVLGNRMSFFRVWGLCWGILGGEAAWGAAHESIGIVPNGPTRIRAKNWPPRREHGSADNPTVG